MISTFNEINAEDNRRESAADGMVFIPERMRLARAEDPARASPSVLPDGHRFVKADCPSGGKYGLNISIPLSNHLSHPPKFVEIVRWLIGCKSNIF